jgi:uncharacterized delta-60 repeat protein
MRSLRIAAGVALITIFIALSLFAQNQVDLAFNAVPSKDPTYKNQIVQPDGKIIVWGGDLTADAKAKGKIARLNSDGTVDDSFNYCGCGLPFIYHVALSPEGKVLIAGNGPGSGTSGPAARVIRLNLNGSIDANFITSNFPPTPFLGGSWVAKIWGFQADGKMIVQYEEQTGMGHRSRWLMRVNTNGTADDSFTTISVPFFSVQPFEISDVAIAPDGKIYMSAWLDIAGMYSTALSRNNADGTGDSTWSAPTFADPSGFFISGPRITGIDLQPDGKLLVAGKIATVNAVARKSFVRIDNAGNVDLTFTAAGFNTGEDIRVLQSGKILVSAHPNANDGTTQFYRLNSDGSSDGTFSQSGSVSHINTGIILDSSERILFFGDAGQPALQCLRLNPNGDLDTAYNTKIGEFSRVYAAARQADGRVVLAGDFIQMNGVARSAFARINADGTLDASFNPGTGFNTPPDSLLIQLDGKILVRGSFVSYNGTSRPWLARINADGSLDASFAPTFTSAPQAMALQSDGKILVAGSFNNANGAARTGLARLNSDGTLDVAFNPLIGSPFLTSVLAQADGSIVIGGEFSGIDGFSRSNLARLSSAGTVDASFNGNSASPGAKFIFQRPDGKYLLAYSNVLARRNTDGSADGSFTATTFGDSPALIDSLIFQADGKMLVGGGFSTVNGTAKRNFARINANGGVDALYGGNTPNSEVRVVIGQPKGRVILGGVFNMVGNVPASGIARITPPPAFCDFDGDGQADLGVFRQSSGYWFMMQSQNGESIQNFGISGDLVAPGDYDGDGKTDLAVFRPSSGTWWYKSSINSAFYAVNWGAAGDIPMASDFDGDGKADFVYYRPSNGVWYRNGSAGQTSLVQFGIAGDIPVVADMDGDGKADPAIFRPSNGYWWYKSSVTGAATPVQWGQNGDVPVPADYDGDGKTDVAVWRPSNGVWYVFNSSNGSFTAMSWGLSGDRPVAADYDGDGRADIAIYRPSSGVWYIMQSTSGFTGMQYGLSTDTAVPGTFLP